MLLLAVFLKYLKKCYEENFYQDFPNEASPQQAAGKCPFFDYIFRKLEIISIYPFAFSFLFLQVLRLLFFYRSPRTTQRMKIVSLDNNFGKVLILTIE